MTSVLQPVRRRRSRRLRRRHLRRRLTALVVVVGIAAWAGLVADAHLSGHANAPPAPAAAPKISRTPHKVASARAPLLSGEPAPHLFSPPLGGRAAIVVDASTGKVLYEMHAHERLPIASLTKIMTATLVLQRLPLDTIVHVGWTVARVPLVREGLRDGDAVPARTLLYGLLLYSGNDDALALAIATAGGRKAFIALMNREARTLGLHDSHFNSTSGVIDENNYSSVYDLAALTRYALRDARFRAVVRTRVKHVSWAAPTYSKIYVNKNRFLELYPGANGVKTGWTTLSGPCVVESATRHGKTLIAVVLDSPRQYNDAGRLLNLGYSMLG